MFVGHFVVAFLLIFLFPQVPVWVPLFGVGFPDLLWGVLVLLHKEEVIVDKDSALQRSVQFKKYPYSHSLVLTNVISFAVGGLVAIGLGAPLALPVFVLASASHWLLDTVVHLADLPILGFDGDKKVGFGLWKWPKMAFLVELVLFVAFALVFVSGQTLLLVLVVGLVFHGINARSFIGSGKRNPFPTSNAFATAALVGFAALAAIYSYVL